MSDVSPVLRGIALLCAMAVPSLIQAGQAEICYSPAVPFQQAVPPTNSTVFNCPLAGNRTLPQLAADGWSIVQLTPISTAGGASITDQLVIQKP